MVEQDSVGDVEPVGLAVVHADPVGVDLGAAVGAARVERGPLVLRRRRGAEHLRRGGLVDAGVLEPQLADRLQQPAGAEARHLAGVLGHVEGDADVALGPQVVDLVGPELLEQEVERGAVVQVAVVEEEAAVRLVRVLVDVVDAAGVEGGGAADDAVDLVALGEQQLRQVAAVLAGDAGDERLLHTRPPCPRPSFDSAPAALRSGRAGWAQARVAPLSLPEVRSP